MPSLKFSIYSKTYKWQVHYFSTQFVAYGKYIILKLSFLSMMILSKDYAVLVAIVVPLINLTSDVLGVSNTDIFPE